MHLGTLSNILAPHFGTTLNDKIDKSTKMQKEKTQKCHGTKYIAKRTLIYRMRAETSRQTYYFDLRWELVYWITLIFHQSLLAEVPQ